MPKKPVKRGLKVWVRADGVNGHVCDFDVYTGKTRWSKGARFGREYCEEAN